MAKNLNEVLNALGRSTGKTPRGFMGGGDGDRRKDADGTWSGPAMHGEAETVGWSGGASHEDGPAVTQAYHNPLGLAREGDDQGVAQGGMAVHGQGQGVAQRFHN